jgi:hypothetical protein
VLGLFCQSGVPSYFVELEDCIGVQEGRDGGDGLMALGWDVKELCCRAFSGLCLSVLFCDVAVAWEYVGSGLSSFGWCT